ncbi:MAG: TagF domain-containing protein [Myxococcota bacterium]
MSHIAFFGKVPSAADFVRRGVQGPVRDFENWFHDGIADLRATGAKAIPEPLGFLWPHPAGTVLACAAPSQDRIGRTFPKVAVSEPRSLVGLPLAHSLLAARRFWREATAALEISEGTEPDAVANRVRAVDEPSAADVAEAAKVLQAFLDEESVGALEQSCFDSHEDACYAYHTLQLATREAPPSEPRVLACPNGSTLDCRAFWAEAIDRSTGGRLALPLVWGSNWVLIALGRAPASMVRFAAGLGGRSQALWPLVTDRDAARSRARSALEGRGWPGAEDTLSRLIDALVRLRS